MMRSEAISLLGHAKLAHLWGLTLEAPAGDVAEVGVYNGGSALLLTKGFPGRDLYLFDTFTGLPEAEGSLPKGMFPGNYSAVRTMLPEAHIYVGTFPDTAWNREALEGPFAFVHADGDLASTTAAVLDFFWPRMAEGGIIVFDDYSCPLTQGVKRVLDDSGIGFEVSSCGPAVMRKRKA